MIGRAQELRPQSSVHVDRGDRPVDVRPSGAVRGGQRGRALFEVPRLEAENSNVIDLYSFDDGARMMDDSPALRGARDGQREDRISVAVAVARVLVAAPVARCPHEDGSLALAALY